MPDEDAVADLDAVADERVALDLAALADHGAPLHLDVGADLGPVADLAPVEVGERANDDAVTENVRPKTFSPMNV